LKGGSGCVVPCWRGLYIKKHQLKQSSRGTLGDGGKGGGLFQKGYLVKNLEGGQK